MFCDDEGATVEAHRAWLADCVEVLRRFTKCPFSYGHRSATLDNPRRLQIDCADDQCMNSDHVTFRQCDRPHHDAAELVAAYDSVMSQTEGDASS